MQTSAGPRALFIVVAASVVLIPSEAHLARAPDIIQKTFEYRGEAARNFADLLQLPAPPATLTFDLSQAEEHRALPGRDAALREPGGSLSSELGWRTSTQIRETVTYRDGVLKLDGYVADLGTSSYGAGRPRFTFSSPGFAKDEIGRLAGWKPLVDKLMALSPVRPSARGDERRLEVVLPDGERIEAVLYRTNTWDAKNQPVERYFAVVGFGPTLPGAPPASPPTRSRGGC